MICCLPIRFNLLYTHPFPFHLQAQHFGLYPAREILQTQHGTILKPVARQVDRVIEPQAVNLNGWIGAQIDKLNFLDLTEPEELAGVFWNPAEPQSCAW